MAPPTVRPRKGRRRSPAHPGAPTRDHPPKAQSRCRAHSRAESPRPDRPPTAPEPAAAPQATPARSTSPTGPPPSRPRMPTSPARATRSGTGAARRCAMGAAGPDGFLGGVEAGAETSFGVLMLCARPTPVGPAMEAPASRRLPEAGPSGATIGPPASDPSRRGLSRGRSRTPGEGAVGPHRPPAAAMAAAPCSGRRILCHRGGSHRGGDPLRPLVLRRTSTRSKGGSRLPVRRKKPARPIRSPSLLSRFGQHRSRALFVLGGSPCALDEMGPSFRTGLSACGTPCGSIWTAASAQPARSTAARPPSKPWSRSARARRAIQSPSFKGRSGAEPDPDAVRVTVQGWPLQEGGTTLPGR